MKRSLSGKVAMVTGASSGIGLETALGLAGRGASAALTSRREHLLQDAASKIRQMGMDTLVFPADLTDADQAAAFTQAVVDRWGRVDILVSNAGEYIRSPILELDIKDVERSMAVNFYSHLYLIQSVLPAMMRQKTGHIILVSTMDAKKGLPMDAPYVSAKSALSGFGEVMRQELKPHGISVTTLFPGRVDTPMIEDLNVPWISAKVSSESVAQAILRAVDRRPAEVIVPFNAALLHALNTFSPRLADWSAKVFRLQGWNEKE